MFRPTHLGAWGPLSQWGMDPRLFCFLLRPPFRTRPNLPPSGPLFWGGGFEGQGNGILLSSIFSPAHFSEPSIHIATMRRNHCDGIDKIFGHFRRVNADKVIHSPFPQPLRKNMVWSLISNPFLPSPKGKMRAWCYTLHYGLPRNNFVIPRVPKSFPVVCSRGLL